MKTTIFLKQALLLLFFAFSSSMWGQILGWQFGSPASSGDETTYAATTVNANLEISSLSRGNGITATNLARGFSANAFSGSGSAAGTKAQAESTNEYFEFTVKAKANYKASLSTLDVRLRRTSAGPNAYIWKYSLDGTNFTEIGSQVSFTSTSDGVDQTQISLSNITSLQNVPSTTTITFRLYAWGANTANASTGTFAIARYGSGVTTNCLAIGGTVDLNSVVPTWNGSSWDNGTPSSSTDAVIAGNYNVSTSFTANNLTVNTGNTLTITNGTTVTATNVTNNGSIVVDDGGNFIQSAGGTYANSGNFTVNKNTTSVANKYVFWASPIVSQNMYGIHTSVPQYVMTYDTTTDYYSTLSNPATSTPGVGYSVKMPTASAVATFGGTSKVPNNGDVAVTLSTVGNTYNLVGNPYPSNLNLNTFYNNGGNNVGSTFWFWDNTSNSVTTQTGNTTTNVGYATYNAAGSGTWTEAPSSSASHSGNAAAIGQGFIVEATGATATFTNAMRVSATGNTFNKLNGNDSGKFWLKLATPYGSHTTLAVNYEAGALNGYDKYDSRAMGTGSDAFYSTVGSEKLVIQGKSPFTIDDVVLLGNKHFEAGNFVISLTKKEGFFNNGQAIYLHDKDLGTYTNLQSGNYSFSANAGEFANRFEIVYKLGALSTQEIEKGTFEVYRDGEGFVARNSKNIEKLEVFDASGRKVIELKPNASSVNFRLEAKGMYVLRAISAGKEYTEKLIK